MAGDDQTPRGIPQNAPPTPGRTPPRERFSFAELAAILMVMALMLSFSDRSAAVWQARALVGASLVTVALPFVVPRWRRRQQAWEWTLEAAIIAVGFGLILIRLT